MGERLLGPKRLAQRPRGPGHALRVGVRLVTHGIALGLLLTGSAKGVQAAPELAPLPRPAGSVQDGIQLLGVQPLHVGCWAFDVRQQSGSQWQDGGVELFAPVQGQLYAHANPGAHHEAHSPCGQGVSPDRCKEYVKGLEHGLIFLMFLLLGITVLTGLEGLWYVISWPFKLARWLCEEWQDFRLRRALRSPAPTSLEAEVAHG